MTSQLSGEGSFSGVSSDFNLNNTEARIIESIINRLRSKFTTIESVEFQNDCAMEVSNLPRRVRGYLNKIASNLSTEGFYIVSGFNIDNDLIGPTPVHWDAPWGDHPYLREEIFQCLVSASIGSLFGWRTQENGRILRHIVPIEKDADEQLGGSSSTTLLWHTEEAFHPGRADYLTLMCYRNNEQAETVLANVRKLELGEQTIKILSQERFLIEPDKSHLPENNESSQWEMDDDRFSKIHAMLSEPRKCAILHGTKDQPMMVVDQAFMSVQEGDPEAKAALDEFHAALDKAVTRIVMRAGDLIIVDNLSTAHGRSIYEPDYGPQQRWIRRVNIRNGQRAFWPYMEPNSPRVMT